MLSIIPMLGLKELFDYIIQNKKRIFDETIIKIIEEAEAEYGADVDNPYSGMQKVQVNEMCNESYEKDVVDILIDFEQKRICTYNLYEISKDEYLTIVLSLLSWLSLEHKRELWKKKGRMTCLKPMKLNLEYPWCQHICTLIEKEDTFKNNFIVKNNSNTF